MSFDEVDLLEEVRMNKKYQVFTPRDYVNVLLDSVGYTANLMGKRFLENSCGDGNILLEAVQRYIKDCKCKGISVNNIKNGLSRDFVGVEIDKKHCDKCIEKLNSLLDREGIPHLEWQIFRDDFLRKEDLGKFDFIVGNPPYITYSEMKKKDQSYLKETFDSCKKGKFDYSYAFIERSIKLLLDNAKMSYLIPSSIFKTVYGSALRKLMLPYIVEINEYAYEKVFSSVLVKSAIIVLEKNTSSKTILYRNDISEKPYNIEKNELNVKWAFSSIKTGNNRFGDYFKVSYVVATLLNDVFVIKDYERDDNGDYTYGEYTIEQGIVRETASPRSLRLNASEKIIFPYYYDETGLIRYDESELKKQFPGAYRYLFSKKARLLKRDSDNSVNWFEFGRTQALTTINCEKCLISTVVSSEVKVYKLNKECIPYGGMYIYPRSDNEKYNLEYAMKVLRSDKFKEYVDSIGIHINGNSLRITAKDIENFTF